jgi:hypothetical protein
MNPDNVVASILGSVTPNPTGSMSLDPGAFSGAPPWVLAFVNSAQACLSEVGALKLALLRRALLTEPEIQEAMILLNQSVEAEFKNAVQDLQRQLNQRPNQPPTDPRSSPG